MKLLHIYIIRCTLLVAMLFTVSWASIKAQTQVATPTFAWNGEQLTIATETEGADIYYSMSRYSAEPTGDGSEANPFNVAAAIAKCKEIGETASTATYYIKGIVSQITYQYGVQYGDATFNISDNGSNQNFFIAYRVLYIGNQNYTEGQQQVQVGDDVVICGKLVNYKGNTPETVQKEAYLVSMNTPELTTKYESPITVPGNTVVRAKATKQGMTDSEVVMTSTGIAAYAALNDDNTVLTFYYDDQKNTRNGMDIGPFTLYFNNADNTHSVTGRPWESNASTITTVIFDESLANYTQLTNMVAWFTDFTKLTTIQGLNYLNTEKVTDMSGLFWGCSSLRTLDLSTFNTSNVTSMWSMFDDCTSLTSLNISTFNTSKVTDMRGMFYGCSSLTSLDLSHFDVSKVFNFNSMFRGCSKLENLNISGWTTSSAQSMQVMFGGCESLTSIDVSHFDTSNATNILQMFYGCRKLQSIDLSNFKTPNVTAMHGMFYRCESLKSLDVSTFDTSKATSMYSLFAGCSSLVSLDISGFNTANVTSMTSMFSNCSALQTIYIGKDWSTASVTESGNMFTDCTNLKGGAGTTYDASHVDYTYAHIDGGESNPGYFTAATEEQPSTDESNLYPAKNIVWGDITWKNANNKKDKDNNDMPFLMGSGFGYKTLLAESVYMEEQGTNVTRPYYTYIDHEAGEKGVPGVGLYYKFTPKVSGQLRFNTWVNKGNRKTFIIKASDGTPLEPYVDYTFDGYLNGQNQPETGYPLYFTADEIKSRHDESGTVNKYVVVTGQAFWGWITVNLNGGESYYIYQQSSQLGFGGYDFTPVGGTTESYVSCIRSSNNDGTFVLSPEFAAIVDENGRAMNVDEKGSFVKFGTTNMDVEALGSAEVESVEADFGKPYAVLSDNNTVLTFYYDDQKEARGGMDVGPFVYDSKDKRGWSPYTSQITKAVFDQSFDQCTTLTSTAFWFTYMTQLETIEHIEYLHTDNVEDMNCMFDSCYVLRDLDVSHFVTAKVTNMQCMFNRCEALTSLNLSNFNTSSCTFMRGMFYDCKGLTSLDLSSFNTSNNTSTEYMFQLCSSLENIIFGSGFSTENVTNMRGMFDGCSSLKSLNVGGFNTQKVSLMTIMFRGCSSLTSLDVSSFNTEKVTDMGGMFSGCEKLTNLDVSSFNTSNVTMMAGMFLECSALKSVDLKNFNTSQVTSMQSMFAGCKSLETLDVSHFDTGNVTNMKTMFSHCENLMSLDVTNFNTSKVLLFNGMFQVCPKLTTLDLSSFNTERATEMSFMFIQDSQLTDVNVGSFNTANVTTTYGMFAQTGLETLDLRNFDTHHVKDMNFMFAESTKLSTIYVGNSWSTANVEVGDSIFYSCPSLVGGQGTVFNPDNISVEYAHVDGGENNPGYLTEGNNIAEHYAVLSDNNTVLTFYYDGQKTARKGMDIGPFAYLEHGFGEGQRPWHDQCGSITSVVIDESMAADTSLVSTGWWFYGCTNLKSVKGWENLPAEHIVDMWGTFEYCSSLPSDPAAGGPNFSNFKSTSLERTCYLFRGCTSMTSLDLSSLRTTKLRESEAMFEACSSLTTIYASGGWTMKSVTSDGSMFTGCTSLVGSAGTTFDENHTGSEYARVDGGSSNPGYLTYKKNASAESSFNNNGVLVIDGTSNMDEALRLVDNVPNVVEHITAVVWNSSAELTENDLTRFNNPNMLIYTNDRNRLDQNRPNVITNGEAITVVLTDTGDNNNFYCPIQFTAKSISYTRNFKQTTQVGVSRGWETIALPFAVQTITHEKNGTLTPFGVEGGKPFWLKELTENGLVSAQRIDAYVPYLISMPNNSIYPDDYNQAGQVTFSATNAVVPVTESRETSGNNRTLIPTMMSIAQSPDIYVINRDTTYQNNPQGSIFVADYREVRPFEAYVKHVGGARYFSLSEIPQLDVTGIESIELQPWKGEQWWTLDGRKLNRRPSKKGIYIRNGKKVVVDATF